MASHGRATALTMLRWFLPIFLVVFSGRCGWGQFLPFHSPLFVLQEIEQHSIENFSEEKLLAAALKKAIPEMNPQNLDGMTVNKFTRLLDQAELEFPGRKEQLETDAIRGMLDALGDPYAEYGKETDERARFLGFGIILAQRDGEIRIAGVFSGSPAQKSGIKENDRLLAIDGEKPGDLRHADDLLSPTPDTVKRLSIERAGKILIVSMIPQPLSIQDFESKSGRGYGYIRIRLFTQGISDRFYRAAERFHLGKLKVLIIDLRNCAGGDLTEAARIAGFFLRPGQKIFVKETRQGIIPFQNAVARRLHFRIGVLVNGGTASAAEVLASALADHGARLYGQTTLGKGTIQSNWILGDSWLRLTTARYMTSSGHVVEGHGIVPTEEMDWSKGNFHQKLEWVVSREESNEVR